MLDSPLRVCATVYLSIILSVTYLSFTLVKPNVKESSVKVKRLTFNVDFSIL